MPSLSESLAALRIGGDTLDPDEISRLLNCNPTKSNRKGETKFSKSTGKQYVKKSGAWILQATANTEGNVDVQVEEILAKLPVEPDVWQEIRSRFKVDLYCGWFMEETNEGLEISAKSLHELGLRGIQLSIDLYAPDTDA